MIFWCYKHAEATKEWEDGIYKRDEKERTHFNSNFY